MCLSQHKNVRIVLLNFRSLFALFCTGLIYTVFFSGECPSIFVKLFGHANRVERHMNKALIEAERLGIQMSYRQLKKA